MPFYIICVVWCRVLNNFWHGHLIGLYFDVFLTSPAVANITTCLPRNVRVENSRIPWNSRASRKRCYFLHVDVPYKYLVWMRLQFNCSHASMVDPWLCVLRRDGRLKAHPHVESRFRLAARGYWHMCHATMMIFFITRIISPHLIYLHLRLYSLHLVAPYHMCCLIASSNKFSCSLDWPILRFYQGKTKSPNQAPPDGAMNFPGTKRSSLDLPTARHNRSSCRLGLQHHDHVEATPGRDMPARKRIKEKPSPQPHISPRQNRLLAGGKL